MYPGRCGRRHRGRHRRARRSTPRVSFRSSTKRCRISPTSNRRWRPTRRSSSRAATRAQGTAQETGDLDAGFKQAAHIVEQTYATHVITHVCLETHGTRLRVGRRQADGLGVHAGGARQPRSSSRMALEIPQTNVRVITQYMGGGFGSKFDADAEGLICARLAQGSRSVPVKLMLDRKEEHLDTGNRPSASAHIRAGVSADGMLTAFDAQSWGTGGAGAGVEFPAAVHLRVPEPPAHAQGRLHQRRPAARDARAGPSAGMLPHRNPDGRARRSRADGSGRVPHQEPARRRRRTRCGRTYFAKRREGVRLGQAPSDRRRDSRARSRPAWAARSHQWGGGGRGSQAHVRHHVRRQRRDEVRHAGHRHRHADDRRDGRGRNARAAGQRGEGRKSATRSIRSAAARAAARRPRASRRRFAWTAGKALDALFAKVGAALGVDPRNARRRRTAASTSRTTRRRAWRGRTPAS